MASTPWGIRGMSDKSLRNGNSPGAGPMRYKANVETAPHRRHGRSRMIQIRKNSRKLLLVTAAIVGCAAVFCDLGQAAEQASSPRPEIRGPIVTKPVKPRLFPGRVQDLPKVPPGLSEGIEVNPRLGTPSNPTVVPSTDPVWQ